MLLKIINNLIIILKRGYPVQLLIAKLYYTGLSLSYIFNLCYKIALYLMSAACVALNVITSGDCVCGSDGIGGVIGPL